jgi:nicotinate-nucleotide pyrophosphorylase (carboxylating)
MFDYRQVSSLPEEFVSRKIDEYLEEDAPTGDSTSIPIFPETHKSKIMLRTRENCTFAGSHIIGAGFGNGCQTELLVQDGQKLKAGDHIAYVSGPTLELLRRERIVLNLLQRLSGIATKTAEFVDIAKPHGVTILDTRKTIPGLRMFEKYAVACGGGKNHRYNLSEGIMIKDNHIAAAGSITEAIESIQKKFPDMKIEIEVDSIEQIPEALASNADGFLLDNMNRQETIECVKLIRQDPRGSQIAIESSGGITIDTITHYLDTGIDYISLGAITHSAPNIDIHAEVLEGDI